MKIIDEVRLKRLTILPQEYFDGKCPFCQSMNLIVRSSRVRSIPDLGSTIEKVIVDLTVSYYECKQCERSFTPEHPFYPPNYQYSLAIIQHALVRYHYQNASGKQIAEELRILHNVEVQEANVYVWLKEISPEFVKSRLAKNPQDIPATIKTITVDGSYIDLSRDIIGKKKAVESLSVTKLADRRYLLMWWE